MGVPFEERWARFDEAMRCVASLVRGEPTEAGRFYSEVPRLAPLPDRRPQIWFGAWGSDRRIAATTPMADGWMASAYNATPDQYAEERVTASMSIFRAPDATPRPSRTPLPPPGST